jgi:glycosyltransferase involved in cell wall biosynthesis
MKIKNRILKSVTCPRKDTTEMGIQTAVVKSKRYRVLFITILPSPYQRDLFGALAARDDVDLKVCYMQARSSDSPWPEKPLRSFERIMPGLWMPLGINWNLPVLSEPDIVVLSTYASVTGQWLMRSHLRKKRWLFWGERLRGRSGMMRFVQDGLAAPLGRASGVVGVGRAAENEYSRRFPNLPHYCIPYHCELSAFSTLRKSQKANGALTFLFCGQMIRRKGVDLLLRAFDRLVVRGFNVRLLLVGREADLPDFMKITSPAARVRIDYEGFQPPERLPEYFGMSDIFVLPSRHDGWGVVINQALAAGLPVITSDAVGAGLDLVDNHINGIRVAAADVEALYSAMETFALSPDLAQQWGIRSRERAVNLTPEAGAGKWVKVFDSLTAQVI